MQINDCGVHILWDAAGVYHPPCEPSVKTPLGTASSEYLSHENSSVPKSLKIKSINIFLFHKIMMPVHS